MTDFTIKDSGARQEFDGGMVRDTEEGKIDYTSCLHGVMFDRWNTHMTKGRKKYPDPEPGVPNWTLGAKNPKDAPAVLARAERSAFRHFRAWLRGDTDEDHAAGLYFNVDVAETCKATLAADACVENLCETKCGGCPPWDGRPGTTRDLLRTGFDVKAGSATEDVLLQLARDMPGLVQHRPSPFADWGWGFCKGTPEPAACEGCDGDCGCP